MTSQEPIKIIVIGGGTSGLSAATRARRINEHADITIIDVCSYINYRISIIPRYVAGTIKNKEEFMLGGESRIPAVYNIKLISRSEVTKILPEDKKVIIRNIETHTILEKTYDKLIIATGNKYILPKLFSGAANFFKLRNIDDAIEIREYIRKTSARNISIISDNIVSVLLADQFLANGFNVNIISEGTRLVKEFDDEFNLLLIKEMESQGINVYLNSQLEYIKNENDLVTKINIGEKLINTHLIIYLNKIKPNVDLARDAGLVLDDQGNGILVDEKMQTSNRDIFAIGSIATSFSTITKGRERINLYGPAQFQGRVAGTVAAGGLMNYTGILGTKIVKFNNLYVGSTGMDEEEALKSGFTPFSLNIFSGNSDRFVQGSKQLHLKIIVDKITRRVLGAFVAGRDRGVDKKLDVLVTAIYSKLTIDDLINLNLSYIPDISTYKDPINLIGMIGANRLDNISDSVNLNDINKDGAKDYIILDIGNKNEYEYERLSGAISIPLEELRTRYKELEKDKKIYVYGKTGLRSYIAERILKGLGFEKVFNVDGGLLSMKLLSNVIK